MDAPVAVENLLGPLNDVEQKNAPRWLYARGDRSLLRGGPRVAIVGAREVSDDGKKRTSRITRELVTRGVIVVSGLARGVDAIAHRTAIKHGGRTIAVVGTGIDRVFPPEHRDLQDVIARDHLLVSQFPPGMMATRGNFPQRNRTMALIADASVIVEASDSSGTLHQGWEAIRLGRPLFIMKSVFGRALKWPDDMVTYGAFVLETTEDIWSILPHSHDDSYVEYI